VGSRNQVRIVNIDTQSQVSINDLRDVDIFAGFTDDELEQVAKLCHYCNYRVGEHCSIQGMISDELKILIDGKVDIEMRVEVPPSAQTLRIATLTRGILDFSAFLEPHTPTTSAICIENAETICIKVKYLDTIFQERPSIEHKMMKNIVKIMGFRYRASRTQLARLVAEMVKLEDKQS
jgi:CRP/FNR family cyclic AMP-dependent transcriptional regulator